VKINELIICVHKRVNVEKSGWWEGGAHLHKHIVIINIYFPSANILQLTAIPGPMAIFRRHYVRNNSWQNLTTVGHGRCYRKL
jgi:hypothetical protein